MINLSVSIRYRDKGPTCYSKPQRKADPFGWILSYQTLRSAFQKLSPDLTQQAHSRGHCPGLSRTSHRSIQLPRLPISGQFRFSRLCNPTRSQKPAPPSPLFPRYPRAKRHLTLHCGGDCCGEVGVSRSRVAPAQPYSQ